MRIWWLKKAKICRIIKTHNLVVFIIKYNIQFLSKFSPTVMNGIALSSVADCIIVRQWMWWGRGVTTKRERERQMAMTGSPCRGVISSGQVLVVLGGTKTNQACHPWVRCVTLVQTYRRVFIYIQIMSENTIEIRDHFALWMNTLHIIYNNM